MIFFDWSGVRGDIGSLTRRFDALPKHIAKKHILSAMKKAIKAADGVNTLKRLTPKGKAYYSKSETARDSGGRFVPGSGGWKRSNAGAMRRAVTVKAKYLGRNADGMAVAALGYKYGADSKKAIWLEFGTGRGVKPRRMVELAMLRVGTKLARTLQTEMLHALDKAPRELGHNPGWKPK